MQQPYFSIGVRQQDDPVKNFLGGDYKVTKNL